MKCGKEYNLIVLMHLAFGNQHFEPIETIISFSLQSENLKTKWEPNFNNNIPIQKEPNPSFCHLTLGKELTSYNQNLSNLYILSKTKRPFKQLEPSLEKYSKEKKQCFNPKTIIWTQSYG
jgi:hypothetical protein